MVAVLAALGAAFLIWFHNDPQQPVSETSCTAPSTTVTVESGGPWYPDMKIETTFSAD